MSGDEKQRSREPERLRRGKLFHRQIQDDWQDAEGEVTAEKTVNKPSGRSGRVDVFVVSGEDLIAIAEIKSSDWDAMSDSAIRRNVKRQARQIWGYIESQLTLGKDVCPGVIFPVRPRKPDRLALVERLFDDEGIPVVWDDETIEERRSRG